MAGPVYPDTPPSAGVGEINSANATPTRKARLNGGIEFRKPEIAPGSVDSGHIPSCD